MSHKSQKTQDGTEPESPAEEPGKEGASPVQEQSLEKIREILFGDKTRVQEERLDRIEEALLRELGTVRNEVQRRIEALEARMKKDVGDLERKLLEAEREGILGREQLARDIDGGRRHLEERVTELADRSDKNVEFVQEQLAGETKATRDGLARRLDEITQGFERAVGELKSEKADRATLANQLFELSSRIAESAKKVRND